MTLYKHQQRFLTNPPTHSALLWETGTGKTRTALMWARHFDTPTLVICPKALKANWQEQAEILHIPDVHVVTKEEFRRDHKDLPPLENVIVDEVHLGFLTPHGKSKLAKALIWYLKQYTPRVLLLTATAYSSSPWNIYQLAKYLGHNWHWQKFNERFFNHVWMGNRIIPQAKPEAPEQLAKIVKGFTSVVRMDECIDIPPQHHEEPEYFALTASQQRAIKEYFDPLPIVRFTKQHQIEQGILPDEDMIIPCDKIDRIMSLIAETNKIVFVCRYNYQIERLADLIQDSVGRDVYIINGQTKNRHELTKTLNDSTHAIVLLQSEVAEGYELPTFPVCVFVSMSYSYTKYKQMLGRFLRINNPSKTTFVYLLTAGDSVDRAVYKAIQNKQDFDLELYAKERT